MPRMIIVDPAWPALGGHHPNYNRALIDQADRHGLEAVVLGSRLAAPGRQPDPRWIGVFSHHQYWVPVHADPSVDAATEAGYREQAARLDRHFRQTLTGALDAAAATGDLVVFHSLNANILPAVAGWVRDAAPERRLRVLMFMMHTDYLDYPAQKETWRTAVYREALAALAEVPPSHLRVVAENREIADDLMTLSGARLAVGEAPHVKPQGLIEKFRRVAERPRPANAPLTVSYLGESRPERGAAVIPAVFRRVSAARPDTRLTAQMSRRLLDGIDPTLGRQVVELRSQPNVTIHDGFVDAAVFYSLLARTDVLLLPYSAQYAKAGSGLFWEALALGKVMVVPAGTFLAREAAALDCGATVSDGVEAEDVAAAAIRAIDEFATLSAAARTAGPEWQRRHDLDAFFDDLLARF